MNTRNYSYNLCLKFFISRFALLVKLSEVIPLPSVFVFKIALAIALLPIELAALTLEASLRDNFLALPSVYKR